MAKTTPTPAKRPAASTAGRGYARSGSMQSALYQISEAAHAAPDLPALFRRIHQIIAQLLPADNFYVALYDAASDLISFPYYVDEFDAAPPPRLLSGGRGLTELVLRSGEPILLSPETSTQPCTRDDLELIGTQGLDWLGVPLKTANGTIGVLAVQTYSGAVRYCARDQALLHFVSDQVASAVERKRAQQATLENEERFRSVFDHSPIIICLLGFPDGVFQDMNAAGMAAFGYERAQLRGKTSLQMGAWVEPADRDRYLALLKAKGSVSDFETRMRKRNGEIFTVLFSGAVITVGGRSFSLNSLQDISERKRAEQWQQHYADTLRLLMAQTPLTRVLDSLLGFAEQQVAGARGCILLVSPDGAQLRGAAGRNVPTSFLRAMDRLPLLAGGLACAKAANSNDTLVCADLLDDSSWAPLHALAQQSGLHACWSHPIRSASSQLLGIFCLFLPTPAQPRAHDLSVLQQSAGLAAVALERARDHHRIEQLAFFDSLTGLPNRARFMDQLGRILRPGTGKCSQGALLFIDLDRFKEINDSQGHAAGDLALVEVGKRLQAAAGPGQTLARLGGDEFVLIAQDADLDAAVQTAVRLQCSLEEPMRLPGHAQAQRVGASIGIAFYPADGTCAEDLIKHTDIAMYRAKAAGGGYRVYRAEMGADMDKRLSIALRLGNAIEEGRLQLHYQPQVDLASARVIGAEALLRWRDAELGWISPSEFIPIAEQRGMMGLIGNWVLRTACADLAAWRDDGWHLDGRVAINLSALQLDSPEFVPHLLALVRQAGLQPDCLELELTESSMMVDPERAVHVMRLLGAAGFSLAIDDFGTGYSSLSYLKRFAANQIKIDISFVRNMLTDSDDRAICGTIIAMARSLGLKTTAEGVEKQRQAVALLSMGCDYAQGHYFGAPETAPAFAQKWLRPAGLPGASPSSAAIISRHLTSNPESRR